jgi:hypothetical protein
MWCGLTPLPPFNAPSCQVCKSSEEYYESGLCLACPSALPRIGRAFGILVALSAVLGLVATLFFPSSVPEALKPLAMRLNGHVRSYIPFLKMVNVLPKVNQP